MISRSVIDRIGFLDDENFPVGYGEENDYCLRARDAGFRLAVADQCFVYHAKSRSFGSSSRASLARKGRQALLGKHGPERIDQGTSRLRESPVLRRMRDRIQSFADHRVDPKAHIPGGMTRTSDGAGPKSVLYVLPVKGGSGGANSVVQEVIGLGSCGVDARVATHVKYKDWFRKFYGELVDLGDQVLFYHSDDDLISKSEPFDVIVATLWSTPALIAPIARRSPDKLFVYYVQDYEPWFFPNDAASEAIALDSYTLIPNMVLMAKTDWLCDIVRQRHCREVYRVAASLDHDIYRPGRVRALKSDVVRVAAMVRLTTPRRAPLRTLRVLREVANRIGSDMQVVVFGCETRDMESYIRRNAKDIQLDFHLENLGVLTRAGVAEALRSADIFVDLSDYQAFGRTGLEAMACGCAVVLPQLGGTAEYAVDGENACLVDTSSFEEATGAVEALVADRSLRCRMARNGTATASKYDILRASLSELSVFRLAWSLKTAGRKTPAGATARLPDPLVS